MEKKHTKDDLIQRQALPLSAKILLTKKRIREFYEHFNGDVYISFSGGKDSTVLLTIAREMYPHIKAVYCDTGLEFPEVKAHVKTFDNVDIIRPEKTFREVIEDEGWVFPSKEVANLIRYANKKSPWALYKLDGKNTDGSDSSYKARYKRWKELVTNPPPI